MDPTSLDSSATDASVRPRWLKPIIWVLASFVFGVLGYIGLILFPYLGSVVFEPISQFEFDLILPLIAVGGLMLVLVWRVLRSTRNYLLAPKTPDGHRSSSRDADEDLETEPSSIARELVVQRLFIEQPEGTFTQLELSNTGRSSLDLSGMTVSDGTGGQFSFPDDFLLASGQRVRLHPGTGSATTTDRYVGTGQNALDLSAGTVHVIDQYGRKVITLGGGGDDRPESDRPRVDVGDDVLEPPATGLEREATRPIPAPAAGHEEALSETADRTGLPGSKTERVLKSIPVQTIAGWIFLQGLFSENPQDVSTVAYWGFFLIGIVVTILFMARLTNEDPTLSRIEMVTSLPNDPVRLGETTLAVVSFIIWVISLGPPFNSLAFYNGTIAAAILGVYTIWVIPFFQDDGMYQPDPTV